MARRIAVIDSETDPFSEPGEEAKEVKPFVWGYFDGETYEIFWERENEFVKLIKSREEIIYAHNGSGFDFPFLYRYLDPGTAPKIVNGKPISIPFGLAELRESLKILPVALSKISKDKFDYRLMKRCNREAHKAEIIKYLKRDLLELYRAVTGFADEFGAKLTIGSVAMDQYRKIEQRTVDDQGPEHYAQFKPFYFGGRCEVAPGKLGPITEQVTAYDINSAYPWACTLEHPIGSIYKHSNRLPKTSEGLRKTFATIKAVSRGCLPFRAPGSQTLYYPRDSEPRIYNATGWEIEAGLETGTLEIHEVIDAYTFRETWNAREFVEHFYERKSTAKQLKKDARNEGERNEHALAELFAKLVLNNLYGKLCMNGERFREYELITADLFESAMAQGFEFEGTMGDLIVISEPADRQPFYDIVPGASITGAVRAKLWRAICEAPDFYYCDTDSIFTGGNFDRSATVEISSRLGAWDIEGEFLHGGFAGRKLYGLRKTKRRISKCAGCGHGIAKHSSHGTGCSDCDCRDFDGGWKTASKGTRLSYEQIMEVVNGGEVLWQDRVPRSSIANVDHVLQRRVTMEGKTASTPLPPRQVFGEKDRIKILRQKAKKDLPTLTDLL